MSRHASPTVVGGFVVGGIALAVVAIVILGSGRFFRDTQTMVVYFSESVNGLKVGAPVKFKGIDIGSVKSIRISMSRLMKDPNDVRIPVLIEIDEERLAAEGVHVNLDDPARLGWMIESGLRAQLATSSLITGIRYVALEVKPGSPLHLVADPTVDYPEIPVVSTGQDRITDQAAVVADNLAMVDFAGLASSIESLATDTRTLVASPELAQAIARLDPITANLNAAVVDLRAAAKALGPDGAIGKSLVQTTANASALTSANGAIYTQLDETMAEVQEAARSLRRLTDQLGRDPGALLRGGRP